MRVFTNPFAYPLFVVAFRNDRAPRRLCFARAFNNHEQAEGYVESRQQAASGCNWRILPVSSHHSLTLR